ncbi:hypothetical protein NOR_05283 [Metarhizium rileyi]|uniref:Uncharacterized protein n=1 Tax=Metarhizium rileyi (strain RCEF 4871) TaxID=1649241 RepID=A0A167CZS9_METRR|nr:hypothetical protein NOR_05283 [Metarhizium rileyi RCEF 4871]TWU70629.1 hypothetical protein ED733_001078 [Metarhizium rileyi]
MLESLILAALLPLQALAGLAEAPIPGYDVVDLTWEVEVFPGHFENLTGTVERIHDAAKALNPDWKPPTDERPDNNDFVRRYYWKAAICGPGSLGWHACKVDRIQEGIDYLRSLPGSPRNGPGPGACGRVSCSWQAAIWWCNDAPVEQSLHSWKDIADSAQLIAWKCATGQGWSDKYTSGQAFSTDDWNVIVRQDEC